MPRQRVLPFYVVNGRDRSGKTRTQPRARAFTVLVCHRVGSVALSLFRTWCTTGVKRNELSRFALMLTAKG